MLYVIVSAADNGWIIEHKDGVKVCPEDELESCLQEVYEDNAFFNDDEEEDEGAGLDD